MERRPNDVTLAILLDLRSSIEDDEDDDEAYEEEDESDASMRCVSMLDRRLPRADDEDEGRRSSPLDRLVPGLALSCRE